VPCQSSPPLREAPALLTNVVTKGPYRSASGGYVGSDKGTAGSPSLAGTLMKILTNGL
jgi:hypothetical protein